MPLAPFSQGTKNDTSGTAVSGDRAEQFAQLSIPQNAQQTAEQNARQSEKQSLTAAAIAAMGLGGDTLFSGGNSAGASGLLGKLLGQNTPGTTELAGTADSGNTAVLLQEILKKLDDIQRQLSASASSAEHGNMPDSGSPEDISSAAAASQEGAGRMVRFRLDGYDMLTVCRTVYLSAPSEEGFLVTGDCGYSTGGAAQEETFYLLFRKTGAGAYEVAVELSQEPANESTFLFRFSGNSPYTAAEAGNTVVLRSVKPNQRSDIVVELTP
jgi:hypothetical protein